jgi:hypothetical protein
LGFVEVYEFDNDFDYECYSVGELNLNFARTLKSYFGAKRSLNFSLPSVLVVRGDEKLKHCLLDDVAES